MHAEEQEPGTGTVAAAAAMATAVVLAPTITLSTNLWFDWAQIAISHALSAQEARQCLIRA